MFEMLGSGGGTRTPDTRIMIPLPSVVLFELFAFLLAFCHYPKRCGAVSSRIGRFTSSNRAQPVRTAVEDAPATPASLGSLAAWEGADPEASATSTMRTPRRPTGATAWRDPKSGDGREAVPEVKMPKSLPHAACEGEITPRSPC